MRNKPARDQTHVAAAISSPSESLLQRSLPFLVVAAAAARFYEAKSGDASIYFTYFKNLFVLPFSYQPHLVSYGATSPLHVLIHAPIFYLFGQHWLLFSKFLNFLFLYLAVRCLNRAIHGNAATALLLSLLTVINVPLMLATGSLLETALAYVAVAALYLGLTTGRVYLTTLLAGSLHLIRPEFALLTVVVYAYLLYTSEQRLRYSAVALASFLPVLWYYGYMYSMTGTVVPSSAQARMLYALEMGGSWPAALWSSFVPLISPLSHASNLIYFVGTASVIGALATRPVQSFSKELLVLVPIALPFFIYPPGSYASRYLVPATPILSVIVVRLVRDLGRPYLLRLATVAVGFVAAVLLLRAGSIMPYDYDRLLLHDLAERLNPITVEGDRVLIYEIQAQYYLTATCYSLDGIVGSEIVPVLVGSERLEDFIRRENIGYLVTMNAFNYRTIFRKTFLVDLYQHDLENGIGSTFIVGGFALDKILTNPYFEDPQLYREVPYPDLNVGTTLRVNGDSDPRWTDRHIMWHSVYRVRNLALVPEQG